jgi:transposase
VRKKRAYRASDVKKVVLAKVLESGPAGAVTVGLDVGKQEVLTVVRWVDGTFERPWKVQNPSEIAQLVQLLQDMAEERPMIVAMESTGTYGDALREALTDAELDVQRVGGKAASDYAEIFDGVPSKHDGKDAAIVAELAALGKSWPWPYQNKVKNDAEMAYWVDWLDAHQSIQMLWVALGDPRDYHCGEAYRKAMGLNLKERSSGKHKGRLKISKRGPSTVRRWLYFAAMRATQDPNVRRWYEVKKAKDGDRGKGALIGVARRLALALYGVAVRDEPFEAWRLFPGRSQVCRLLQAKQKVAPVETAKV